MGQKVSPNSLRFGIIREWNTVWIGDKKQQAIFLHEDILIRKFLTKKFGRQGMISKITITRPKQELVKVLVHTSRPGYIFGEEGKMIKETEFTLVKLLRKHKRKVKLEINKIENPDTNAQLIADWIAQQLENRVSFRIAQKKAIQKAMRAGLKGIKTQVSGRLAGADMARSEGYAEGIVPLHTLRSDVHYALSEAKTTYGILGVKVWVCYGEIIGGMKNATT